VVAKVYALPLVAWSAFAVGAVVATEFVLLKWQVPSYLFPLPSKTVQTFFQDSVLLWNQFLFTFMEWSLGVVLSIFLGAGLAFLCFEYKFAKLFFEPLLFVSQSIPYLTFAPLLLLWFGLGKTPKVILIVLTCAFPIALMGLQSLEKVKSEYQFLVKILKLSNLQCYKNIYLPGSLSGFFAGLKISVSYAFVSAVMSELIGSEAGLGVYLLRAQSSYRIDKVLCCVLIVVVFSLLTTWLVELLRRRIVFWEKKVRV
jgi:putative hydroxymethylpyrimidine transport system permease protein